METEEWNLGIRGMVLSGPIVHPRWQFAYAERLCKAHVRHPDGSRDNVVTGLTMRRFASDGLGPRAPRKREGPVQLQGRRTVVVSAPFPINPSKGSRSRLPSDVQIMATNPLRNVQPLQSGPGPRPRPRLGPGPGPKVPCLCPWQ